MNLGLKDQLFLVGGCTSGFGKAIAIQLIEEGAQVIGVARTPDPLNKMIAEYSGSFQGVCGDISEEHIQDELLDLVNGRKLAGAVINAGGPPAGGFFDCDMDSWDEAYRKVLRWKVRLTQKLVPLFQLNTYGRIVYIESVSVKQGVPNLILSNSLRAAVVGMVKTLSQEVAKEGVNLNILAPGYHLTPAMQRLIDNRIEKTGHSEDVVLNQFTSEIPKGKMGELKQFASLAIWLLSKDSEYITGQTFSVDGGLVRGVFG